MINLNANVNSVPTNIRELMPEGGGSAAGKTGRSPGS